MFIVPSEDCAATPELKMIQIKTIKIGNIKRENKKIENKKMDSLKTIKSGSHGRKVRNDSRKKYHVQ